MSAAVATKKSCLSCGDYEQLAPQGGPNTSHFGVGRCHNSCNYLSSEFTTATGAFARCPLVRSHDVCMYHSSSGQSRRRVMDVEVHKGENI